MEISVPQCQTLRTTTSACFISSLGLSLNLEGKPAWLKALKELSSIRRQRQIHRFRRCHQQHSQIVYNKKGGGRGWKRVQKFPGTHPFPFSLNNHLPTFIVLHPYWHFKAVLYSKEKLTQAKKQKNAVNYSNIFQTLQINLTSPETYQDTYQTMHLMENTNTGNTSMLTLLKNQVFLTFHIHSKALTQIHFLDSYLCHQDFMDQRLQRCNTKYPLFKQFLLEFRKLQKKNINIFQENKIHS